MSFNAELANASRWLNAYLDRLPAQDRPDAAELWAELAEAVNESPSEGEARQEIARWRFRVAAQLGLPT